MYCQQWRFRSAYASQVFCKKNSNSSSRRQRQRQWPLLVPVAAPAAPEVRHKRHCSLQETTVHAEDAGHRSLQETTVHAPTIEATPLCTSASYAAVCISQYA